MHLDNLFERLMLRQPSIYINAVLGVFAGAIIFALSWQLSGRLLYSGFLPEMSPIKLMRTALSGAICFQFFLGFLFTRWLWHERQIERGMFALISSPLILYPLSHFGPIETQLLLMGMATCWAAIHGRTRFQRT